MITAYVDSVSGDHARIVIGEEGVAIALPLHELPRDLRAGTLLRVRFTIEGAAAPKEKRE